MRSFGGRDGGSGIRPAARAWIRPVAAIGLLLLSVCASLAGDPSAPLGRAVDRYWEGLFTDAVVALGPLTSTLAGDEQTLAYEYLARSLVRLGDTDRGKAAFKDLLRLKPDWRPDAKDVAGPEMSVFETALAEYENEHLGGVSVRTEPTRANVYLDDALQKEPTPLTIERVPAGDHAIRVELAGYATVDTTVSIAASGVVAIDLVLGRAGGDGEARPFWKKRWVRLAAGGVFGAGIILALAGGGDGGGEEPGDLPGFPEPPHR